MPEFLQNTLIIVAVVMVFNFIIFFHELGHFWAARWRGLKIDRFQIWFGKPIWSKTINGVQYGLGWIPAGGFVALPQMAPMEAIEGSNAEGEPLPPIKPIDKIIVAFAGPLFSFLLAAMAAVAIWKVGKPNGLVPTTTIGWVQPDSAGAAAGLQRGDKILAINGNPIRNWDGRLDSVFLNVITSRGKKIEFTVDRPGVGQLVKDSEFQIAETSWWQRRATRDVGIEPIASGPVVVAEINGKNAPAEVAGLKPKDIVRTLNGEEIVSRKQAIYLIKQNGEKPIELGYERDGQLATTTITPRIPISGAENPPRAMIGAAFDQETEIDDSPAHPNPIEQITDTVKTMWITIVSVISPDSSIGVQHLSGPIGMGKFQFQLWLQDHPFERILGYLVLVNINLAILNMLPFPVLDGGHIVLATMEWIARRPVRVKFLEVIQLAFVFLLLSVMVYVSSKDAFGDFQTGKKDKGKLEFPVK
jgi:regulator of sigma E protease